MHSKSELALAGELFELLELIVVQTVLNQIQADDQAVNAHAPVIARKAPLLCGGAVKGFAQISG